MSWEVGAGESVPAGVVAALGVAAVWRGELGSVLGSGGGPMVYEGLASAGFDGPSIGGAVSDGVAKGLALALAFVVADGVASGVSVAKATSLGVALGVSVADGVASVGRGVALGPLWLGRCVADGGVAAASAATPGIITTAMTSAVSEWPTRASCAPLGLSAMLPARMFFGLRLLGRASWTCARSWLVVQSGGAVEGQTWLTEVW